MTSLNLRHSVRAIVLDEDERMLLCRFVLREAAGTTVLWAAPGGGVAPGETPLEVQEDLRAQLEIDLLQSLRAGDL